MGIHTLNTRHLYSTLFISKHTPSRTHIIMSPPPRRLNQPRVTLGPRTLPYYTMGTGSRIVTGYSPAITGNDNDVKNEPLPGEWTLVKETNMESREPQDVWRKSTLKTTHHLSRLLKNSLLEHPHPKLSEKGLAAIEELRKHKGDDY